MAPGEDLSQKLFVPLVVYFFATLVVAGAGCCVLFRRWYRRKAEGGDPLPDGVWGAWRNEEAIEEGGASFVGERERPFESWQINPKELKLGPLIGVGNVGEVYRALYRGRTVAVKKLLGAWYKNEEMVDRFREEAYLMSTLNHPNVLAFKGAVWDRDAGNICIVTEFCERGTLTELLSGKEPLSWQHRLRMARDIALGMSYLHTKAGIIQRDLKSSNLLVSRDYNICISDFGLSRLNAPGRMNTYCGTPAYLAPEIVRQDAAGYTEKADVFSYGVVLWELLTREEPYPGSPGLALAYAVATQGLRPPIPAYCPAEWALLMSRCWADNPAERPSFDEIQRILAGIIRLFDEHLKLSIGAGQHSHTLTADIGLPRGWAPPGGVSGHVSHGSGALASGSSPPVGTGSGFVGSVGFEDAGSGALAVSRRTLESPQLVPGPATAGVPAALDAVSTFVSPAAASHRPGCPPAPGALVRVNIGFTDSTAAT